MLHLALHGIGQESGDDDSLYLRRSLVDLLTMTSSLVGMATPDNDIYLEDLGISHQLLYWILRVETCSSKNLEEDKKQIICTQNL